MAPAPPPPDGARRALARFGPAAAVAALLVIVALALAVRIAPPWSTVFHAPGDVRLFDTDSYYHLRHARAVAEHYPRVMRWDEAVFPGGRRALYAGLYDVLIATAGKLLGSVELGAAWTPPILGGATFVLLFWLTRAAAGTGAGLLAAFILLLAPGIFLPRSLLGYADHHVAEAALAVATAAGLLRCLQVGAARPWWRPAPLYALPLSLFLFTWYGAPIYVLLIALTLFVCATVSVAAGRAPTLLARAAARYALGAIVVAAPAALLLPWLVMEPRLFRLALAALGATAGGLALYALLARALLARRLPGPALALAALAAVGAGGYALVHLSAQAASLAGLILGVKTELVAEQLGFTVAEYFSLGGAAAALAFLALPLALLDAWRGRDERTLAPVLLATAMVGLWLRTHDYGYAAPPFLAFLAALVITRGYRRAPRLVAASAAVALLAPVWPLRWTEPPIPSAPTIRGLMLLDEAWATTMKWTREHTPPGRYGVRGFWDFGHFIAGIAERPTLVTGAISRPLVAWYLLEDEDEAVRASRRLGDVRYTLADAQTAGSFFLSAVAMVGRDDALYRESRPDGMWVYNDAYRRTMISRLWDGDGDGLSHYRMVYASPQRSVVAYRKKPNGSVSRHTILLVPPVDPVAWEQLARSKTSVQTAAGTYYDAAVGPAVKLFEEVAGARLAGSAPAGATVEVRMVLRAEAASQKVRWHRTTTADAAGRWEVVVPYPTEEDPTSDVVATGPYEVRVGDRVVARVPVRVTDVRAGGRVEAEKETKN